MSDRPWGQGWWQASDGRWYPPEARPAYQPPPPPPAPRPDQQRQLNRRAGFIAVVVVVGVLFVNYLRDRPSTVEPDPLLTPRSTGVTTTRPTPVADPSKDVKSVSATSPDAIGAIYVDMTVTNHSAKRSDYWIEFSLVSPDRSIKYGGAWLAITGLEPGQTTTQRSMPVFPSDKWAQMSITYTVRRTPS